MVEIDKIFNQPEMNFVLLPKGRKSPPIEKDWPNKIHHYDEANEHVKSGCQVGIVLGNGYFGIDMDNPASLPVDQLPETTAWRTRPGRYGVLYRTDEDINEVLREYGKEGKAQLFLTKDGRHVGELKLQKTYQVIPPAWKEIDGEIVEYELLKAIHTTTVSLREVIQVLIANDIKFDRDESRFAGNPLVKPDGAASEKWIRELEVAIQESETARAATYAKAALEAEAEVVAAASEGSRNITLNRAAFAMGTLLHWKVIDESDIRSVLRRAARSAGLPDDEIQATLDSGLKGGMAHPRGELPDEHAACPPDYPNDAKEITPEEIESISKKAAVKFTCNLPPENFIRRYMEFGKEISDAYPEFWFAGGIFALATIANKKS